VEDLRQSVWTFIRDVLMDAEPAPGECLSGGSRAQMEAAAKAAGVSAPHAPSEHGGQGLAIEHCF
jgi:acyl-CoA dehydrogenase